MGVPSVRIRIFLLYYNYIKLLTNVRSILYLIWKRDLRDERSKFI